jgi:hypothetical protein
MRRTIWVSAAAGIVALGAMGLCFGVAGCGGEKEAASPSGGTAPTTSQNIRSEIINHEECPEGGHRVENLDTNNDGKPDIKRVYDGNVEICRSSDMNHDGKPDMYEFFDKSGVIRRREVDFDDNGIANLIEHYEAGKLASRELDTTNQGRLDTWDTFDVATGKIVKRERDSTNDGRIDQWWTYDGDKVTIAMDRNGDGLPDPEATVIMGGDGSKPDAGAAPTAAATDGGSASPQAPVAPVAPAPTTEPASASGAGLDAGAGSKADAGVTSKKGAKK